MHVCVSRGPNGVLGSVLRRPEWFRIEWSLTAFMLQPYFGSHPSSLLERTRTRAHRHANAHEFGAPHFPVTPPLNDSKLARTLRGVISVSHLRTPSCLPHPAVSYIVLLQLPEESRAQQEKSRNWLPPPPRDACLRRRIEITS